MAASIRKLLLLKPEFTVFCALGVLGKKSPCLFCISAPQLSEDGTFCHQCHQFLPSFVLPLSPLLVTCSRAVSVRIELCNSRTSLLSTIPTDCGPALLLADL